MNKLVQRFVVLVAVTSCVALACAQGNGGGGQGRRGGGFQGRRGGGNSEITLVMRADVQKELAITDDEKTKLTDLRSKQRQNGGGRRNGGGGNGGGGNGGGNGGGSFDPAEFQKRMEEQRTQQHKDLAAILTDSQMKRLGELLLQRESNNAIAQPDVQKALNMTADQIQKVKDLQTKQRDAQQGLMEKVRNQEMTREEVTAAMQKNTKTMNEELGKILTADQAAKLKEMQGKEFKFEENNGGGR